MRPEVRLISVRRRTGTGRSSCRRRARHRRRRSSAGTASDSPQNVFAGRPAAGRPAALRLQPVPQPGSSAGLAGAVVRSATIGVIGNSVVATTGSAPTGATLRRGQEKSSARPAGAAIASPLTRTFAATASATTDGADGLDGAVGPDGRVLLGPPRSSAESSAGSEIRGSEGPASGRALDALALPGAAPGAMSTGAGAVAFGSSAGTATATDRAVSQRSISFSTKCASLRAPGWVKYTPSPERNRRVWPSKSGPDWAKRPSSSTKPSQTST